jgi:SP family general alpha glucoside:H+ symporter-like MFS transporter
MEGYDTSLIGSLFAYPTFAKNYGGKFIDGKYQIPAPWQTGLQNGKQSVPCGLQKLTIKGSAVGSIFGLIANGYLCDWFGYKKVMVFALTLMTSFIFVPFFAPNIAVLEVGQILCGIPWGIFQTLGEATIYNSHNY